MSYDIHLTDPVSGEVLHLPFSHTMHGGTYAAEYDPVSNKYHPMPIQDAWLNITYNYSKFYYEATDGDKDFYGKSFVEPGLQENLGIRGIYGKTGGDSIPMLERMIDRIKAKYPNPIYSDNYWDATSSNALKPLYQLLEMAKLRPDGVWGGD